MHKSAFLNAQKFANKYCANLESKKILDVGSWDGGNGNLRPIFTKGNYTGLDIQLGPNVDVIFDGDNIPFQDNVFDVVVSSSCFEHVEIFWLLFLEMSRVLKVGGSMYINAPSSGPYHPQKCPSDSWRFYPDSWRSLAKWANRNNLNVRLLESYIDSSYYPPDSNWLDSVGIFTKDN